MGRLSRNYPRQRIGSSANTVGLQRKLIMSMYDRIGLRTTHPIGCRANFPIHPVRFAMKFFKHIALPVNFLPRCNGKRLESSDRIAKLTQVIIDFIFLLIIRGSSFELIPAPLLFALNLIAASALATSVVVLRWSIPIEAAEARCCSFSDTLMHFAALGLKAFLVSSLRFISGCQLCFLLQAFLGFVECDGRDKYGAVESVDFCCIVVCSVYIAPSQVEVAFRV